MTSTDSTTAAPSDASHPPAHPHPAPSPALPPPPLPPRPRSKSSTSSSAPMRRFTHCIFTRPHHPTTRWYLTFLHEGTYSEVYIGHPYPTAPTVSTSAAAPVAIKVGKEGGAGGAREDEIRTMLYDEGRIMQQLQSTHSVCRLYHQPQPTDEQIDYLDADEQRKAPQPPFIAMTLLLCDVSQLRKEAKLTRLAMWEVFVLMLRAMRGVHEGRVLHRDVKPSNFGLAHTAWSSSLAGTAALPPASDPTTGSTSSSALSVYIIDFGQSTHAFQPSSSSSPASSLIPHLPTSFKGKSLFASIARHEAKPQGRSDDLVMLLYIALDFLLPPPGLPWKLIHDKRSNLGADRGRDEIVKLKREWRDRWKRGERLSGEESSRVGEDVLVGLLERVESVESGEEPPYDEIERELQRGWDEEAKEVGDVGKPLSEGVAEYLEENEELKRKLNDKPPTAEEREKEREERDKKRKERRMERGGGEGRHSVDLTIDTKKYTSTQPLPPTASPPTSATQPHSAWAVHSPYDSSPGAVARVRAWPLQSLCECTVSVKAVLEYYCIAESPRAVKAVNALLLTCTVAELQSQAMQQRTVQWLANHPTVSIPTSLNLSSPPPQSPLFALFPLTCAFDTFVLLCTDACQRLRAKAADNGSVVAADKVVESVLAEWTALEGEKLQQRVEQLMKDRETVDLTTLLPPPTSTLGGRTAKATPSPAAVTPAARPPAASAVPAAPAGQAAAKSIVDSWMQLPSKPIQQPMRPPIRRLAGSQPNKPPSATPPKLPPPVVSASAPPAPPSPFGLPEPSALVALGKAGIGRRMPRKLTATDETALSSTPLTKPDDSTFAPPTPALATASSDEVTAAANNLSIDASSATSNVKPPPAPTTVKKTAVIQTTARKSVQEAKLLAKERAPITDDMLRAKAAHAPMAAEETSKSSTSQVTDTVQKIKTSKAAGKPGATQQDDDEGATERKHSEAARGQKGARKQKGKTAEEANAVVDEEVVSLNEFTAGQRGANSTADDKPKGKQQKGGRTKEKAADEEEESSDGEEGEEEADEAPTQWAQNDEGVWEMTWDVDYDEPPEDDVVRVYVSREEQVGVYAKIEEEIASTVMAKYYRRAPFRLREKVLVKYRDNKWYEAVIVALDRTHDQLEACRAQAVEDGELQSRREYTISGVQLLLKQYKGKAAHQLQANQLWCYNILWKEPESGGEETMWCVENRMKHASQSHAAAGKERKGVVGGAMEQVGKKRGRRGSLTAEVGVGAGDDQTATKKRAVNPIEQMLAEVPVEEVKESNKASVQPPADSLEVSPGKQSKEGAVKPDVTGKEANKVEKHMSDKDKWTEAAAIIEAERAAGTETPKQDKPDTTKASPPTESKEQPPEDNKQAKDGGQGTPHKPLAVTESADVTMTENKDNSDANTPKAESAVEVKANEPAGALVIDTDTSTAEESSAAGEGAAATAAESSGSGKGSTTPLRHIPKKGGRFSSKAGSSPTSRAQPPSVMKETTASETTATATNIDTAVKATNETNVHTVKPGTVAGEERKEETSAMAAVEEKSADAKTEKSSSAATMFRRDHSTRRASAAAAAPPSSLSSLSSPPALSISLPPPAPPKPVRQRSRLSEGEKLQLEAAKANLPGSSPQSGGDSPSLNWNDAGSGSRRTRGRANSSAGPAEEADAQLGRKRGRGSGGEVQDGERKEESKEEADSTPEVDIVGSKKRRRGSTSSLR